MPRGGSVYAWWNLPREQKELLKQMRQQGMFGGTPGRAPYFWVLEGTHNPQGAIRSGPTDKRPSNWMANAIKESVPGIVDAITGLLG